MANVGGINLKISEDDAVVLLEFFERFDKKERFYFVHPAEYISLMKISAQIDKSTSAIFRSDYRKLLEKARERIAEGFESNFTKIEKE